MIGSDLLRKDVDEIFFKEATQFTDIVKSTFYFSIKISQ
ncbi:hypothetical protein L291_2954 [Acinetobacter guillouiae MSP4-18]|nr:hypothetical protein L291_2954 [Acinetobacter guillouiae MSP4-18]